MYKKILLILLFFAIFSPFVLADEAAKIEISSDLDSVSVGDTFQVSIKLENASTDNLNIGNMLIPGIEQFRQRGSSQSTKVQMINGATSALTETVLTLQAIKEGVYTIGPIEVKTSKLNIKSNTVNIEVKKQTNSLFSKNEIKNDFVRSNKEKSGNKFSFDWIVNILAFLSLIFLVHSLYKRNKKNNSREVSDSENNEEIKNIEVPNIDDQDFYKKTKESLLNYIEKKYDFESSSLTNREISEELTSRKIYNRDEIIKALEICDRGSFAKDQSAQEELLKIVNKLK